MLFLYKSSNGFNLALGQLSELILTKRSILFYAFFWLTIVQATAQNPLSPAGSFNIFLQGNATLESNESEGAVAIGGNLTVRGYQVAFKNINTNGATAFQVGSVTIGLVVGGGVKLVQNNLKVLNGTYLKIGNCTASGDATIDPLRIWYKDDNNAINNIRITKQGTTYGNPTPAFIDVNSTINTLGVDTVANPVCQANVINFASAFTQLKTNSTNLTACLSNTETWADGAKVTDITGKNLLLRDAAGASGPHIWNITGAQLNAINNLTLDFTPSATRPLIVNVTTGASFTWNVVNQNVNGTMNYIIWNFPNVTGNLVIGGSATVEGSILAPNASIDKATGGNNSNIEGQLIAQTFTMTSGEMHTFPFLGQVPSCNNPVCIKPNAGKDTTICITSIQLKTPAQDEVWTFLSSNNGNTASITSGGLASGLSVSGQYRFVLKKIADTNCSDTITVTRANFLLPSISDKEICPGTTLTFGYQGLSGVSYAWNTGATTATISVSPTQTTNYTVTVTSGNTGCQVKDTIVVVVNPKPNAGKDTIVCATTAKVVAAGNGETWSFLSFNDPSNPSNTTTASITQQGNITGLTKAGFYRFVLTNAKECTDTIRVQRRVITLPQFTFNPICPGTTLTFGYQDSTNFSYAWNTGATTAKLIVKPTISTNYIVTATELSTQCQGIDTVKVIVKPAPTLTLVSSVCSPDNAKYVTTVTVSSGAVVTSNAGVVSGSGTSFTVTVGSDTISYTITATLDGCKSTLKVDKPDCTCPQITNPTAQGTAVCIGTAAMLTASGCTTGTTAKWYSNSILTTELGSGASFTTPNLTQAIDYYVACVNDAKPICKSTGVKVTVTMKPYPTFSSVTTTCGADNSTYSVTISSTGVVTVKSPNGLQISGTGPYTIANVPSGTNLVLTAVLNGCSKDTTIVAPACGCTPQTPTALAANVGICEGSPIPSPTFTAFVGTNTTVDWYNASTGGMVLQANSLTFTAPAAGTYYLQAKSTAPGCNNQVNPERVAVTLVISPKPVFKVEAKDATCQGSTIQNDGSVRMTTGTVGNSYAFNTTGFGALPTMASSATAIASLPVSIAQNIANNTVSTTYYIRVFSNEGCYKDTSVTVNPQVCQPNCPSITLIGQNSSDEVCSGPLYLYAGGQIGVKTTSLDSIRFVYFTSPTTNPYTGGTLMATIKPQPDSVAALDQGLPGLLSSRFPVNTGNGPITYYVYAIQKSFTAGTACPPPSAFRTYTLNPVPQFTLDSIPACIGDTIYKVNVNITSSGTFKVIVATGITSIGNGPNPTGVLQTIDNVTGSTQLTLKTTGDVFIFVQNANGCISLKAAPKASLKTCDGVYDLALSKSIDKKTAKVGDAINYTIKVWNEGIGTATNITVRDTLNAGVQYITHATATGNYNPVSKIWTIGSLAVGDTAVLLVAVNVVAQGVWFNTAEICSMTENDEDSTPCNGKDDEDDIDRECFSVPLEVCPGEAIQVSVPQQYTNVRWFKDGVALEVTTGNQFLVEEPGTYTFTASSNTCPAQGCCPIIVIAGTNCCPPDLCVPFTIKQTKKGGQLVK